MHASSHIVLNTLNILSHIAKTATIYSILHRPCQCLAHKRVSLYYINTGSWAFLKCFIKQPKTKSNCEPQGWPRHDITELTIISTNNVISIVLCDIIQRQTCQSATKTITTRARSWFSWCILYMEINFNLTYIRGSWRTWMVEWPSHDLAHGMAQQSVG